MPNDTYAGILNTQAAHDAFGEDARPFYPERAETFNTAEQIAQYKTRIAELERERDAAQQSRARLIKLFCAIDETLPTDGGPHYHGLMGRLNLLTSRLEYAEQGLLDYAILRVGLTERISKAEAERDAAIADARLLAFAVQTGQRVDGLFEAASKYYVSQTQAQENKKPEK